MLKSLLTGGMGQTGDALASFEPPTVLKDAERDLQSERRLLVEIDAKLSTLHNSVGLAKVFAVPSDGEAHHARKRDIERVEGDRAQIVARIEHLHAEIVRRRSEHAAAISAALMSARVAAAKEFLAAAEALNQSHRRLERLRAAGRAAGISTKASILPLHLNAAITLAQAIEKDTRA